MGQGASAPCTSVQADDSKPPAPSPQRVLINQKLQAQQLQASLQLQQISQQHLTNLRNAKQLFDQQIQLAEQALKAMEEGSGGGSNAAPGGGDAAAAAAPDVGENTRRQEITAFMDSCKQRREEVARLITAKMFRESEQSSFQAIQSWGYDVKQIDGVAPLLSMTMPPPQPPEPVLIPAPSIPQLPPMPPALTANGAPVSLPHIANNNNIAAMGGASSAASPYAHSSGSRTASLVPAGTGNGLVLQYNTQPK